MTPGADDVAPTLTRAELGEALDALLPAATGRAVLVVVSGREGMGKSEVVSAMTRRWSTRDEPPVVLSARAAPWEAAADLALLRQVASGLEELEDGDPFGVAAHVARAWADTAGDAGLVVLLDDADSADPASLQVLATTVRHHRDVPVLVVVTTNPDRPTESGSPSRDHGRPPDGPGPGRGRGGHPDRSTRRHHPARLAGRAPRTPHRRKARPHRGPAERRARDTWRGSVPTLPATALVRRQVELALADLAPEALALVEAVAVLDGAAPVPLAAAVAGVSNPLATMTPPNAPGSCAGGTRRRRPTSRSPTR